MTDGHCSPEFLPTLVDDAAKLRSNNNNSSIGEDAVEERQVWSIAVREANREELIQLTGDESRVLSVEDMRSKQSIRAIKQVKKFLKDPN